MSRLAMPKPAIRPLTRDRWDDFETLFGTNGACAGFREVARRSKSRPIVRKKAVT